ncbi:MAG: hypothetical protein V5A36_07845, partial [Natronomonas sp.]
MSLYRYVGVIAPGMSLPRRAALVSVARSLDIVTDVEASIRDIETELQSLSEPVPSRVELRRQVAETAADIETKREELDDEAVIEH